MFGWWRRSQRFKVVSGGALRVHSSELQQEEIMEWLLSEGFEYVRVATRPWEETLRNPTTGRFLEVSRIWNQDAWPMRTEHARALIWRYA